MRTRTLAAVALSVVGAACGSTTTLSPGPDSAMAPVGPGEGTVASETGVRMVVRARAWQGDPETLESEMTPLFVEITNSSNHPLLVRYRDLQIHTNEGESFAALPPYDIDEDVTERLAVYDYSYAGFRVAPYLANYYPRMHVADPYWWDGGYYDAFVPAYRRVRLPTQDMIRLALPEGVLEPGSKMSGFVYFEELDNDVTRVVLTTDLIDAKTRTRFGRIEVPFLARTRSEY
jgi:hypothetical protein